MAVLVRVRVANDGIGDRARRAANSTGTFRLVTRVAQGKVTVCYRRPCPPDCTAHTDKCPKRVGGGIVFRQRKGKGKLTLQCPTPLLDLLREHRRKQAVERLRAGDAWMDHDLVFATQHGSPIDRTEDWRSWKTILREAGVREVRVHDARHTAATLLIEQGVRVVQ